MWRLQLFGGVSLRLQSVSGHDEQAAIHRFRTRKVASLLGYLALQNDLQLRETVANLLWPEATASEARNSLRVALTALRAQLEPIGVEAGSVVKADRFLLGLQPTAWTSDVKEFESLWKLAASQKQEERAKTLRRAFACYKGTLLLGYEEEWSEPLALYYESLFERITEELVAWYRKNNQFELSLEILGRAAKYLPHYDGFAVLSRQIKKQLALREPETYSVTSSAFKVPQAECNPQADSLDAPAVLTTSKAPTSNNSLSEWAESERPPLDKPILPLYATSFCGREEEVKVLLERSLFCADHMLRLLTLVGPPAIGKTRLGVETARHIERNQWSCVFFATFTAQNEAGKFAETLCAALGIPTSPFLPAWTQIIEHLKAQCVYSARRAQSVVLFLDNLEHLLPEISLEVQRLRLLVPELIIWVSSRALLRLPGEQPLAVSGLPLPVEDQELMSLGEVASVKLFVGRARSANPNFSLSKSNAKAIVYLCHRLEGWPLPLELAAARAHSFTPQQMLDKLRESNDFLRRYDPRPANDSPITKRQSSFEAAIEWSYCLLENEAAFTLQALSIFRDGATIETLQRVMARWQEVPLRTPHVLMELVAHSLVKCEERNGNLRYSLLEGVRQFAWNRLPELDRIRLSETHARVQVSLLETPFWTGECVPLFLNTLDTESEDVRAALEWCQQHDGLEFVRVVSQLWRYWELRGLVIEGCHWLELAYEATHSRARDSGSDIEGAQIQIGLARLRFASGNFESALPVAHSVLSMCETGSVSFSTEQTSIRAQAHLILGIIHLYTGQGQLALESLKCARGLFKSINDEAGEAHALIYQGFTEIYECRFDHCYLTYKQAVEFARRTGDLARLGLALFFYGDIQGTIGGRYEQARPFWEESLQVARRIGDHIVELYALWGLCRAAINLGELESAQKLWEDIEVRARQIGYRWGQVFLLETAAFLAAARKQWDRAALLLGAAERARENLKLPLTSSYYTEFCQAFASLWDLPPVTLARLWRRGRSHSLEQALDIARGSTVSWRELDNSEESDLRPVSHKPWGFPPSRAKALPLWAECHWGLGQLNVQLEDWDKAHHHISQAKAIYQEMGDTTSLQRLMDWAANALACPFQSKQ